MILLLVDGRHLGGTLHVRSGRRASGVGGSMGRSRGFLGGRSIFHSLPSVSP